MEEHLKNDIEALKAQRDNALAVYHQACGALQLCEALIERNKSLTLEQLGEMLGAKEVGEPVELDK